MTRVVLFNFLGQFETGVQTEDGSVQFCSLGRHWDALGLARDGRGGGDGG